MSEKRLTDFKDLLLEKKVVATLAVERKNRAPHITPVWFNMSQDDFRKNELTFNTLRGRVKFKLLSVGSKISLSLIDPDKNSRYLSIEGIIINMISGEVGIKHINELSQKYNGEDASFVQPGDERIKYVVKIQHLY